jgi:hypothetical protein
MASGAFSGRSNISLHIDVATQSTNASANTSVVAINVYLYLDTTQYLPYDTGQNSSWSATVNGVSYPISGSGVSSTYAYDFRGQSAGYTQMLLSTTQTVTHGTNGDKTISFSTSSSAASPLGSASASGTLVLTNFDRSPNTPNAPTLTRSSAGTTISITNVAPTTPIKNSGPAITSYSFQYSTNDSTWTLLGSQASATYSWTSATSTTAYYFRTAATNSDGTSSYSASTLIAGIPTAVTGLAATPSTTVNTQVALAWTASSTGSPTSYKLYINGVYKRAVSITSATITSSDGIVGGTSYTFGVSAVNAIGESTLATVVATPNTYPTVPRNVIASPSSNNYREIYISWTAPASTYGTISAYNIYVDGSEYSAASVSGTTLSTTITKSTEGGTDLSPGTSYSITVKATNGIGQSAASTAKNSYPSDVPSAPTFSTLTASTSTEARLDLTWSAPTSTYGTLTGYDIYTATSLGGTYTLAKTVSGSTTSTFIDSTNGLSVGVIYYVKITARNAIADANPSVSTNYSATLSVLSPGVPSAPRNLAAAVSSTAFYQIVLSWDEPSSVSGGITGYTVYSVDLVSSALTQIGTTGPTTRTFTVTGLTRNQTYKYAVKARNAYADSQNTVSASSNVVGPTTAVGPPDAPTSLVAVPSTNIAGRVVLQWVAPTGTYGGLTGYTLYNGLGTVLSSSITSTATSFNVDGLLAATDYTFYLRARNALADTVGTFSEPSNSVTAQIYGAPATATSLVATTSTTIPGRVVLTWTAGTNTDRFEVLFGLTNPPTTSYGFTIPTAVSTANTATIDGLTGGLTYYLQLRSQNTITDYSGLTGTESSVVSAVPITTLTASIPADVNVTNTTNTALTGVFSISSNSPATTFSFDVPITNAVSTTSIPATATYTLENQTNSSLATTTGTTVTITSAGFTTLSYTKSGTNISAVGVSSGSVVNATNRDVFNGTATVYDVTDDVGSNTAFIRYAKTASNIAEITSTGTLTNNSNTVFNTSRAIISDMSEDTITFSKTNANVEDTAASGSVTNLTNRDVYNIGDSATVTAVGNHNVIRYVPLSTLGVAPSAISLGTVTMTLASPAVFTKSAHDLINGTLVYITTTGALPTSLSAYKQYYVRNVTANTFNLSTTLTGALISTASLSQSGTHTLYLPAATQVTREILSPYGEATRGEKNSSLEVKYRSGWLG